MCHSDEIFPVVVFGVSHERVFTPFAAQAHALHPPTEYNYDTSAIAKGGRHAQAFRARPPFAFNCFWAVSQSFLCLLSL